MTILSTGVEAKNEIPISCVQFFYVIFYLLNFEGEKIVAFV